MFKPYNKPFGKLPKSASRKRNSVLLMDAKIEDLPDWFVNILLYGGGDKFTYIYENGKGEKSPAQQIAEKLQEAFKQAGSNRAPVTTHGADTDGDGVPDGWELYMGRSPNSAPVTPGSEDGMGEPNASDYDADGLSYALAISSIAF